MPFITYEVSNRIGTITLARPEKRNALNDKVVTELIEAFIKAENDKAVKVILLKAQGEVFSAGADLEYLQQLQKNSFDENLADSKHLAELFNKIYTLKKVVIAQVEGAAIAGGCGLATVCDFTFATPESQFGYTEVKIGFIPAIVMVFLLRKIGVTRSKELLLTGKLVDATYAKSISLINDVYEKNVIEANVLKFATELCSSASASSLESTKKMIAQVQHLSLDEALDYAAKLNAEARSTEDCKKGINAFLNKEKISW
jgi:methylglutaconyl-CoA hydratase